MQYLESNYLKAVGGEQKRDLSTETQDQSKGPFFVAQCHRCLPCLAVLAIEDGLLQLTEKVNVALPPHPFQQ